LRIESMVGVGYCLPLDHDQKDSPNRGR
jgi:hypothetical protein